MNPVTKLLKAAEAGDPRAAEELLPLVYDELRKLAAARIADERPGQTLDATALVHEAYLRVAGDGHFDGRGHFFSAAAEAMRRILIEAARRKARLKHGGARRRVELTDLAAEARADDLLALDEALERFAARDPARAALVRLRFYGGLSIPEASEALGISQATAARYWKFARAWLFAELNPGEPEISPGE